MQALIDFFKSFGDTILWLVDMVVDFIGDLIDLISIVAGAAATLPQMFAVFPAPAVTVAVTVLAVAVLYKILGREG